LTEKKGQKVRMLTDLLTRPSDNPNRQFHPKLAHPLNCNSIHLKWFEDLMIMYLSLGNVQVSYNASGGLLKPSECCHRGGGGGWGFGQIVI